MLELADERERLARLLATAARESVSGRPTTTFSGSSSAIVRKSLALPCFERTRSTTPTGRASVPVSSLTATPVRALP